MIFELVRYPWKLIWRSVSQTASPLSCSVHATRADLPSSLGSRTFAIFWKLLLQSIMSFYVDAVNHVRKYRYLALGLSILIIARFVWQVAYTRARKLCSPNSLTRVPKAIYNIFVYPISPVPGPWLAKLFASYLAPAQAGLHRAQVSLLGL